MLSSQQQLDLEAETVSITTTFEVGAQSMQQVSESEQHPDSTDCDFDSVPQHDEPLTALSLSARSIAVSVPGQQISMGFLLYGCTSFH